MTMPINLIRSLIRLTMALYIQMQNQTGKKDCAAFEPLYNTVQYSLPAKYRCDRHYIGIKNSYGIL